MNVHVETPATLDFIVEPSDGPRKVATKVRRLLEHFCTKSPHVETLNGGTVIVGSGRPNGEVCEISVRMDQASGWGTDVHLQGSNYRVPLREALGRENLEWAISSCSGAVEAQKVLDDALHGGAVLLVPGVAVLAGDFFNSPDLMIHFDNHGRIEKVQISRRRGEQPTPWSDNLSEVPSQNLGAWFRQSHPFLQTVAALTDQRA